MIRLGNESDLDALLDLLGQFALEAGTALPKQHLEAALVPMLQGIELGEIWVLENTQELIGYLVIGWGWGIESGGKEALIDEVFIKPSHRNQGHGKQLVEHALDHAKQQGAKTVFLETEKSNPESRKLYVDLGFEIEESIWMRAQL